MAGARLAGRLDRSQRGTLLALGVVLAAMNAMFYLAIARLPLATVGAIEFLGTVVLAAIGARSRRNIVALAITIAGVASLTVVQVAARPSPPSPTRPGWPGASAWACAPQ